MKIVFIGTSEFEAIILENLSRGAFKPSLVVVPQEKIKTTPNSLTSSAVKLIAQENKIEVLTPKDIQDVKLQLLSLKPDLIISAEYGKGLPKEIFEIPRYGCLGIHPSLLPRWRGPSPLQYTILNNDDQTGITIFLMDEKIDQGPILKQAKINLEGNENFRDLSTKLANLAALTLLNTIPFWIKKIIKPQVQNEAEASYTELITQEEAKINWQKPVEKIEREIRAFSTNPGSYTFWKTKSKWGEKSKTLAIKILKATVRQLPEEGVYPVGKTIKVDNKFCIQCGKVFLGGRNFLVVE